MIELILLLILIKWLGYSIGVALSNDRVIATSMAFFLGVSSFSLIYYANLLWGTFYPISSHAALSYALLGATFIAFSLTAAFFRKFLSIKSLLILPILPLIAWYLSRHYNFTTTSGDSIYYILIGESIGTSGLSFAPREASLLTERSIYYGLFHSIARIYNVSGFWFLTPLYTFEMIFMALTICWRELSGHGNNLSRTHVILALSPFLLLLSGHYFYFQMYYQNHHVMVASHFLAFILLIWISISRLQPNLLLGCVLVLIPTALMRFENALLVLVFPCFFWGQKNITKKQMGLMILSLSLAVALIHGQLYQILPESMGNKFLPKERSFVVSLGALAGGVIAFLLIQLTPIYRWFRRLDILIVASFAFLVLIGTLLKPEQYTVTILNLITNLVGSSDQTGWSYLWIGLFPICMLAFANRDHFSRSLGCMIFVFLMFIVLLNDLRGGPGRVTWMDSGSRMLFHIYPCAIFFSILTIVEFLKARVEVDSDAEGVK